MIVDYKTFLKESKSEGITPLERSLLKKYYVGYSGNGKEINYRFNPDTNLIDISSTVYLNRKKDLKIIPEIRFGTIYGSFYIDGNSLTTLKNCPKIINGDFNCSENYLTSLEYCPDIVKSDFNCSKNELTSLKHCPKKVDNFYCYNNKLTSLEYCPKKVNGYFVCDDIIKDIEDYPLCIIGELSIALGPGPESKGINDLPFGEIFNTIKENEEIFENLLDDKTKFHQMVMRLNPDLIKFYKTIPVPSKKSNLLI